MQFESEICFSPPLGDIDAEVLLIPTEVTLDLTQNSSSGGVISSSLALKYDGFSLMVVAYTDVGNGNYTAMVSCVGNNLMHRATY